MVNLLVMSGENMFLALKETRNCFCELCCFIEPGVIVTINVLSDSIL